MQLHKNVTHFIHPSPGLCVCCYTICSYTTLALPSSLLAHEYLLHTNNGAIQIFTRVQIHYIYILHGVVSIGDL